jgi:hypothetical protein
MRLTGRQQPKNSDGSTPPKPDVNVGPNTAFGGKGRERPSSQPVATIYGRLSWPSRGVYGADYKPRLLSFRGQAGSMIIGYAVTLGRRPVPTAEDRPDRPAPRQTTKTSR